MVYLTGPVGSSSKDLSVYGDTNDFSSIEFTGAVGVLVVVAFVVILKTPL